jgi:hypothetical protein
MIMNVNKPSVSQMLKSIPGAARCSRIAIYLILSLNLCACSTREPTSTETQDATQVTQDDRAGKRILASGATFQGQQADTVRHRVSANSISIVPRDFGAFNVNDINEILFEEVYIEIFPSLSENAGEGDDSAIDFADTLHKFVDTLPDDYGVITRVRMRDVHITLHGVGKGGTAVNVVARKLLKEFSDDTEPELYGVRFYDGQSNVGLNARRARWNTTKGQFVVETFSAM